MEARARGLVSAPDDHRREHRKESVPTESLPRRSHGVAAGMTRNVHFVRLCHISRCFIVFLGLRPFVFFPKFLLPAPVHVAQWNR